MGKMKCPNVVAIVIIASSNISSGCISDSSSSTGGSSISCIGSGINSMAFGLQIIPEFTVTIILHLSLWQK